MRWGAALSPEDIVAVRATAENLGTSDTRRAYRK